ncbi:phosphatidate phosphatase LPIN3 [Galendromus occidentalis]|uniref:phosphatidate phosphatase n=1 Tax=Galendromus occidentalis TaxID=34638 RepID=A0AAJ6QWD6_9ACAR|nr:phosphatidate phosphatase LPIN3 [Galendromus occidentalis]
MDIVKGFVTSMKQFYNDINPATLTGAIDVIVIEHENGDLVSTPFHVRFGKINVMNFVGKTVEIYINDEPTDLRMKLGASGEAFFVEASEDEPPAHLATSPIPDHPLNDLSCSPRKRSGSSPAVVLKARASNVARKLVDGGADSKDTDRINASAHQTSLQRNEDEKSNASERSMTKIKKRRRKVSKPMEKITRESSSSDVEETQFVLEVEDQSSEMKTAKTTQQNPSTAHRGNEGGKLKEPCGNNTSNTTVTSDDEFNWTSVASGVASARLTPMGQVVSDGDISDVEKGRERPPSPAKSDTLVELGPHDDDDTNATWLWGELPVVEMPPEVSALPGPAQNKSQATASRDATELGSSPPEKALYLDDVLAQTDPEMRKIYIGTCPRKSAAKPTGGPSGHPLEDGESGNGPSLSQSPQSGLDSDCEPEMRHPVFDYRLRKYSDLAMSLCGLEREEENIEERFLLSLVTYDDFCQNPDILHDPDLVFRMNGRYYNWKSMAPQLLSLAMFQTALPKATMQRLCAEHLPKKKTPNATPQVKSRSWWWSRPQEEILLEQKDAKLPESASPGKEALDAKEAEICEAKSASEEELLAQQLLEEELCKSHNKKSLRLSSDQLKSLGLKPGSNFAEFKVITAYQGTSVCSCHIYLWKSTDKVVISDIDGTITKSDVLGHILPIIGNNWAQSGVTSLFNKIVDNGYKMVYLSARAIGQAQMTRGFLRSIKQDNLWLPDGPVLLNPTSLLNALHREVVAKNPHVFKINCLKDVKQLFNKGEDSVATPFYAGFGNKTTDALSYKTVSVPVNRIFTINHKGEISQELMGNVGKTYHCLGDIADHIFPYVEKVEPQGGFNSFSFWKDPLPTVEIKKPTAETPKPGSPQQPPAQQTQPKEENKEAKDSKASSPKKTNK